MYTTPLQNDSDDHFTERDLRMFKDIASSEVIYRVKVRVRDKG